MAPPEWIFPQTVDEALAAMSKPGSMAVAGGTTVADLLRLGHPEPRQWVDISRLPLNHIVVDEEAITVGARVSNEQVANSAEIRLAMPAVSQAILAGASEQIRNAATVGGNLMQATRCVYFRDAGWACNRREPGSGCPAIDAPQASHAVLGGSAHCIATHPSDMAVALLALDAQIHAVGPSGACAIALDDFYLLPGRTPEREHVLPAGALIVSMEIPRSVAAARSGYVKLRGRASYEFATASAAVALELSRGRVKHVAVALGGLGARPWRRRDAEQILIGQTLNAQVIDAFCDRLLAGARVLPETTHKLGLARGAVHQLLADLCADSHGEA